MAALAAEGAAEAGANVSIVSLRDFPMPLYDFDVQCESGLPGPARALKERIRAADGLIIASPEYNGSFSGVLKNAIDWVSRSETQGEPSNAVFAGKTAAICAASPGVFGGIRGLIALRMLLANLGLFVLPDQVTIPNAGALFAADGTCTDGSAANRLRSLGAALARHLAFR